MTLSYKVGSLQVREEELSSMLKLKVQQHYMFQRNDVYISAAGLNIVMELIVGE